MKLRLPLVMATAVLAGLVALPVQSADATTRSVHVISGQGAALCNDGFVCLYENYGLNRPVNGRVMLADENVDWMSDYGFDKIISSVCNHTGTAVTLFSQPAYEGTSFTVPSGHCTDVPAAFNDQTSSMMLN
ncbi:peptidase inhibitor family I36 protein [Kitasatospora sp. NPDC089797]|uniref:peptidase inhibitor family I36 protein n=1 Tax=Kitasatospora sp. NPDC089797 TaxID=3155298 RepID=UPI00343A9C06